MFRPSLEPSFDLPRHFRELFRVVLPIFAIVCALGLLGYALWGPAPRGAARMEPGPPARVGLLPVEAFAEGGGLPFDPAFLLPRPLDLVRAPVAARFDYPLGSPLGALTYNAQPFQAPGTGHLGDDLNGIGGADTDLGDPVRAAGDGTVVFAGGAGPGWGQVVVLLHRLPGGASACTLYGHLERVFLPAGAVARRGDRLGTMGTAGGRYRAHLHFEARAAVSLEPGPGYGEHAMGREDGEAFLSRLRGAPDHQQNPPLGGEWDASWRGGSGSLQIDAGTPP